MSSKIIVTYKSDKTGEAKTLTDWAKSSGISFNTLYHRVKKQKLSIDEAIEASNAVSPMDSITDPESGETHSCKEWSEILGIPENRIYKRIVKYKWPVAKALYAKRFETPNRKQRPKSSYTHIDLTGEKYGYLTVLRRADEDYVCNCHGKPKTEWKWLCECDCGNIVSVVQHHLRNGHCTSCGCMNTNNFIDMTGKRVGHLTVIARDFDRIINGERVVYWKCLCDCGFMTSAQGKELRNGHRSSCGCGINSRKHGMYKTRIYRIYRGMISRCTNENIDCYARYGGRGITVCEDWIDKDNGFTNFYKWAMDNGYDDTLSIDRRDNDDGYYPSNCRWVDMKTQANNRRSNVKITYHGITKTATEWAEELGVHSETLLARHNKGWSDEDIIDIPVGDYINKITSSFGETHTIAEWSEISGLSKRIIYERIFRLNWPVDSAISLSSTNIHIYDHISPAVVYAMQHSSYIIPPIPHAMYYVDILGRYYTPEEWDSHQAIAYDD